MGSKNRRIPGETKLKLVLEGLQSDNVAKYCRENDIAESQFYDWKNKLEVHGAEMLQRSSKKDPENERLEEEGEETKETLLELAKEIRLLKKTGRVCRGSWEPAVFGEVGFTGGSESGRTAASRGYEIR